MNTFLSSFLHHRVVNDRVTVNVWISFLPNFIAELTDENYINGYISYAEKSKTFRNY